MKVILRRVLILSILAFIVFLVFLSQYNKIHFNEIITGVSNPGRILIYKWSNYYFDRKEIPTDFKLVHAVRIGDIYNDGRNIIAVGMGNGFFGPPWGCQVGAYTFDEKEWQRAVIDEVNDPRCKDLTIGDVDNDGKNELVLGTHGEGIIKTYKWDGNKWDKEIIERNWIEQVDKLLNISHRVPREDLTYDYIVQSAVHIVKVGDADNDGKNEIVASISSPLEYPGEDVSYLNLYKWNGDSWQRTVIDNREGEEFRSIAIGDAYNKGKNVILVGSGVMWNKKEYASLTLYEWNERKWIKHVVEDKIKEKNMKGLAIGDAYNKGKDVIVLATGFSQGLIYTYEWNDKNFEIVFVGNISEIYKVYVKNNMFPDIMHNSMEAQIKDIDGDGKNEIIVGGMSHTKNFGWETTTLGFLIVFKWQDEKWDYKVLDSYSVLGMDVGNII